MPDKCRMPSGPEASGLLHDILTSTPSERVTGIEPAFSAWEADVLPLNYTREGTARILARNRLAVFCDQPS